MLVTVFFSRSVLLYDPLSYAPLSYDPLSYDPLSYDPSYRSTVLRVIKLRR